MLALIVYTLGPTLSVALDYNQMNSLLHSQERRGALYVTVVKTLNSCDFYYSLASHKYSGVWFMNYKHHRPKNLSDKQERHVLQVVQQ